MITTLSGVISEKLPGLLVLDVQGVGYGLLLSTEDYGRLKIGEAVKLYVYEYIREQAHDLFGFLNLDTQALFEQLVEVTGVGPKMALNVLNIGNAQDVRQAIAAGDVKFIQQASGVGKRVAERIVVELKDKVGLAGIDLGQSGLLKGEQKLLKDEAVQALVALGYSVADASRSLADIDPKLPTEERIRLALKDTVK